MSFEDRQSALGREQFWTAPDKAWTRGGLTLAEGSTLARRLLASGLDPVGVVCTPAYEAEFRSLAGDRCPVEVLSAAEMEAWAGFPFHRGVAAAARRPEPLTLEAFLAQGGRRLVCAPNLTDPENLGSVYRSALALGWDAVAVGPRSCDPFSRRTAKVSMGAVYAHPPVVLPEDPDRTRELFVAAGWTVAALALEPGAHELRPWAEGEGGRRALAGPLALYLGNEFEGVSAADRAVASLALVLPMAEGHDSLNAAVAAGIACCLLGPAST